MHQEVIRSDSSALAELKAEHLGTLSAPLDAYWEEALIGFADHYEIRIDGSASGFYCLNSDNHLVALHLSPGAVAHGEEILRRIVADHGVTVALAGTNDPLFLSLCLGRAVSCRVHTLLFEDGERAAAFEEIERYSFERATEEDFDEIFRHYREANETMDTESLETGFEGLKGYIRSVLDRHHIFLLRQDGELIATSECRLSATQRPYADLGMIVAKAHRRQGVGSYVLARTKVFCDQRGARPICSCEAGNIGSKKAILRAGFSSRHRVVRVELEP